MRVVKLGRIRQEDIASGFKDVVVIPTETVYGLAARIDNEEALRNIFKIKGRPSDNPLIVHISDLAMLDALIDEEIPGDYLGLMDKFWPGPLTLLFKCKPSLSKTIRGNNVNTVAVRMPRSEAVRGLIRAVGVPLAAPSANTSGRPSPSQVEHAIEDLGEKVQLYIDGGPCEVGVESTVFGIVDGIPTILRPGGVTKEDIEGCLGKEVVVKSKVEPGAIALSPGQKYRHYSPSHPVYLFAGPNWAQNMVEESKTLQGKIGLLKRGGLEYPISFYEEYDLGEELADCTRNIFAGLRALDKNCDAIFVVAFEQEEVGLAITDRIEKAANHIIR